MDGLEYSQRNQMTNKEKNEELKFVIGRFDHYYDSINNKGNLYLTINTFILGGIIVGYYTLDQTFHFRNSVLFTAFIPVILCNLISSTFTFLAIAPFARRFKGGNSRLFFADVSQQALTKWRQQWEGLTDEIWQVELQSQSHQLSIGLNRKFKRLSYATLFIWLQVFGIISFSIYLLTL